MEQPDGRYKFMLGEKRVVVEIYTCGGRKFFDVFVDDKLRNKESHAGSDETHEQILERVRTDISRS